MHELRLRARARELWDCGGTTREVAAALDLPYGTVVKWRKRRPTDEWLPCPLGQQQSQMWGKAYLYLLGLYLGDGHLVTRARTPVLRIYCSTDYPEIVAQAQITVAEIRHRPAGLVRSSNSAHMVTVQSYWMHWPCLFPQAGPGRKHERPIELADWQRSLVDEDPWPLIRGLIHSDGCRSVNTVVTRGKSYSYPRYFFANESRDILEIFGNCLDTVGVAWRYNRPNSISVARRAAVETTEAHVGPKR